MKNIPVEVEEKVQAIPKVNSCKVNIVFEPAWQKEMMSEEARLELGML